MGHRLYEMAFELLFLIVISPSCGRNSCLAVNNLNIQLQCLVTMAQMNIYRVLDISTRSQASITLGEHKAQGRI